jgi:hypothetical protein
MMQKLTLAAAIVALSALGAVEADAQYAVGHRAFGVGTTGGIGYSRMDFQFPDVKVGEFAYELPTLELKVFLTDVVSLDLSVPVTNIAASNALKKYFHISGELYVNFHPTAPSTFELFVAPGIGFSYASWNDDLGNALSSYAFHVPVRLGLEISISRSRSFSFFVALKPFFSLVHGGKGDNSAGGGGLLEIGLMGYMVNYRADRY